jgi:glutathione synthase/RimK-type ligase-like ATP-grasp enzyme
LISAFNKIETNSLARSLGVKLPRETIAVTNDDANRIVAEGFKFPLVLKPEASFKEHDLLARNDVKRVYDARELAQVLRAMLARGTRVIVQELFIGAGAGVELLAKDGKILVALQHMRVHEPLTGGASSYRTNRSAQPPSCTKRRLSSWPRSITPASPWSSSRSTRTPATGS